VAAPELPRAGSESQSRRDTWRSQSCPQPRGGSRCLDLMLVRRSTQSSGYRQQRHGLTTTTIPSSTSFHRQRGDNHRDDGADSVVVGSNLGLAGSDWGLGFFLFSIFYFSYRFRHYKSIFLCLVHIKNSLFFIRQIVSEAQPALIITYQPTHVQVIGKPILIITYQPTHVQVDQAVAMGSDTRARSVSRNASIRMQFCPSSAWMMSHTDMWSCQA
jgi:hypothetical protein